MITQGNLKPGLGNQRGGPEFIGYYLSSLNAFLCYQRTQMMGQAAGSLCCKVAAGVKVMGALSHTTVDIVTPARSVCGHVSRLCWDRGACLSWPAREKENSANPTAKSLKTCRAPGAPCSILPPPEKSPGRDSGAFYSWDKIWKTQNKF